MADVGGGGDGMEVVDDDDEGNTSHKTKNASEARNVGTPEKDEPALLPIAAAIARKRAMPKLQLFDLVAGGAFERALEGMGRQEGGEVRHPSCQATWLLCKYRFSCSCSERKRASTTAGIAFSFEIHNYLHVEYNVWMFSIDRCWSSMPVFGRVKRLKYFADYKTCRTY